MNMSTLCGYPVHEASIVKLPGLTLAMAQTPKGEGILGIGVDAGFESEPVAGADQPCFIAPLTHHNAKRLRQLLPHTAPKQGLAGTCSIGVGDRLGLATPGHLRAFAQYPDVFPVLAQQSIRELNLTGRSYEQVLDSATFAVFRAGWTRGFGADGDHLKKPEEIRYALDCGFSMITLDCSEHIRNEALGMDEAQLAAAYAADPEMEARYLDQRIQLDDGSEVSFDKVELMRTVLIYGQAIAFMKQIYADFIKGQAVDFEISIDETSTPTTPAQHFFVANELHTAGIRFESMAPRFVGEFQKGIDYIGDLAQFTKELKQHAAIAKHFGYKVSVHSGSDKFSVFPAVGQATGGVFHLKTAGTNWLEAVRLVAMVDPALYRKMHAFALESYAAASAYYHVNGRPEQIPALSSLPDAELPGLMDRDYARQVLHITYGQILTAKDEQGHFLLRDDLYACWAEHAEEYAALLAGHIGRHLELLLG